MLRSTNTLALLAFIASTALSYDDFGVAFDDEFGGGHNFDNSWMMHDVALSVPAASSDKELCDQNFSAFYDERNKECVFLGNVTAKDTFYN